MNSNIKALSSISPYIRRAWDGNMPPGWRLQKRVIFDHEFVFIMEGSGSVFIEDREYTACPGHLYLFKPGISHSITASEKSGIRQPHIHFDLFYQKDSEVTPISYRSMDRIREDEKFLYRKDINECLNVQIPERILLKKPETVEELIFRIINEYEINNSYAFLRSKALFIELLCHILEEISGDSNNKNHMIPAIHYETVVVIKEYIRLNYRSKLCLSDIASKANLSENHTIKLFRAAFGITPIQYQIRLRIERGKQLLLESHHTVSDISDHLGFGDVQHFSKVFKNHTKQSPTEFKNT